MKKIFNSRFFAIVVLLIAISTVFTSCLGGKTEKQTVEITVFAKNGEGVENPNTLGSEELSAIATLIYNNTEARDKFIAAYRGYNVYAADFNSDLDSYPVIRDQNGNHVINLDGVKAVIKNYGGSSISFDYSNISAIDVQSIVTKIQEKGTVNLEVQRNLVGNIRFYIGSFLGFITRTIGFGNYLIGICIFAIIIEIFMIPFAIKQQKNSIKQANLRPKEMAIRNRYKGRNDQATQQKVAQEIQDLYHRENFNPMSGCLPMLIQLPIIMLLYNIVVDPVQNVLGGSADFANALRTFATASKPAGGLGLSLGSSNGTIEILSHFKGISPDVLADFDLFANGADVAEQFSLFSRNIPKFNIGSINFGLTPSFKENFLLLIVPVLTFVVYFGSMKISKKFTYQPTQNENAPGAGCSTKTMEFSMPLMSTFFCFMVPGAVGVYWVFRSIISTVKQFIMSKVMPLPKFTEEDYKEAERELNSKRPQRKRKNADDLDPNRERPRSLHHIDDDDEEYVTFVN